jgi:hypothetical protein
MFMCTMHEQETRLIAANFWCATTAVEIGQGMSSADPDMILSSGDFVLTRMILANN